MRRIILKFHPTQPLPADDKKLAQLNEDKPLQITLLYNLGKGYTEILDAKKALEIFEKGLKFSQKNS